MFSFLNFEEIFGCFKLSSQLRVKCSLFTVTDVCERPDNSLMVIVVCTLHLSSNTHEDLVMRGGAAGVCTNMAGRRGNRKEGRKNRGRGQPYRGGGASPDPLLRGT